MKRTSARGSSSSELSPVRRFGRSAVNWLRPPSWTPHLPTTLAGAEICALIAFVGLRGVDLLQLAVATPGGLAHATRPGLDGALLIIFAVESVIIIVLVVRARRYYSTVLATVDTALALTILAAEPLFTHTSDRVGTWTAWGFAVSVGTALGVGIGFPRAWQTWVAATALAGTYLAVSLPDPSSGAASAALSNAVAYFGFALIARGLAGYLRRMGRDADAARATAEQLGREREFERHRRLLHDQATVLHLLSAPEIDTRMAGALRGQAALGAQQIRAFLGRTAGTSSSENGPDNHRLVALIDDVASGFDDLPIELILDLAEGVVLTREEAEAMRGALAAVLHNVRVHAQAAHVTIHADSDDAGRWEVTVQDDGTGFDPSAPATGYGLTHQVAVALTEHRIDTHVRSAPGTGTAVIMQCPSRTTSR